MAKQERRDVPQEHHVARYCNKNTVRRDTVTKEFLGIFPNAFELNVKKKEEYLSAQWFERFSGSAKQKLKEILTVFRRKIVNSRGQSAVPSEAAIAVLNVDFVLKSGQERSRLLRVRDRSKKGDEGYASIHGLPLDNSDQVLLGKLAYEGCVHLHEVAEINNFSITSSPPTPPANQAGSPPPAIKPV
jgi:hypothetical protein